MVHKQLYLASQSLSRQEILKQAHIPFTIISQSADETACDWNVPIEELVLSIAQSKMEHTQLPAGQKGDVCFVLTADTLVKSSSGEVFGKPKDRTDAKRMLRDLRDGVSVVTGFCSVRKLHNGIVWDTTQVIEQSVLSIVNADIPEYWIDRYLDAHPHALQTAGVLFVEGYGAQFIRSINGSYTTVLGLPLYEVRQALEKLGFFGNFLG